MKKNKVLIAIIVIVVVLICAYFVSKKLLNNKGGTTPSIKSLTIDSIKINDEFANNRLTLTGTIDLSIDDSVYEGVSLEGYCIDTNDNMYNMYGPQDGRTLFHSGSSELSLSEVLDLDQAVDWNNVTIQHCKINKMTTYVTSKEKDAFGLATMKAKDTIDINYEKMFN